MVAESLEARKTLAPDLTSAAIVDKFDGYRICVDNKIAERGSWCGGKCEPFVLEMDEVKLGCRFKPGMTLTLKGKSTDSKERQGKARQRQLGSLRGLAREADGG